MKLLGIFIQLIPILLFAQPRERQEEGIRFESDLTWNQIKERSKTQGKYIFVDCYTTWCGPCKEMDQNVYNKQQVGQIINDNFISVKIQMDTSKRDGPREKMWHSIGSYFLKEYKINAFPSYLFFNSDGEIIHKASGFRNAEDFIALALSIKNPENQYFTLSKQYAAHNLTFDNILKLANLAEDVKDREMASKLAVDYLHNHLNRAKFDELAEEKNTKFLSRFYWVLSSKDHAFSLIYENAILLDSVIKNRGYARSVINTVIDKEIIGPRISSHNSGMKEGDWRRLHNLISRKYSKSIANDLIVTARTSYHKKAKEWKLYTTYLVKKVEIERQRNELPFLNMVILLNDNAFQIFKYSDNKQFLLKALEWTKQAQALYEKPHYAMMDTEANLLYKLGEVSKAKEVQEAALKDVITNKYPVEIINELQGNFDKMKQGLPTWDIIK